MSIFIDGQPIPRISGLTRFQTQPFEAWCGEIFQKTANEVNGKYELLYIGRQCEARILESLATNSGECLKFTFLEHAIHDTALERLRRFNGLVNSGLNCKRITHDINVYTDLELKQVRGVFAGCLPNLSFCRINLHVHTLAELAKYPSGNAAYIVLSEKADINTLLPQIVSRKTAIIQISDNSKSISNAGWVLLGQTPSTGLQELAATYLELWTFVEILKSALGSINIDSGNPLYSEIFMLDKQTPYITAVLPKTIELGETAQARIDTVPKSEFKGSLIYRISNEDIIQETSSGLKAIGEGEAVVEVYEAGKNLKLASQNIRCYRRNRITSFEMRYQAMKLLEGESYMLPYSYSPQDADDVESIKLSSSDSAIISVNSRNTITALKAGKCILSVNSERAHASCPAEVFPKVESLKTNIDSINLEEREEADVQIVRIPDNATLQRVNISVKPENLGKYNASRGVFHAENSGKGELIFSVENSSVQRRLPVKINPKDTRKMKLAVMILSLLAIIPFVAYFYIRLSVHGWDIMRCFKELDEPGRITALWGALLFLGFKPFYKGKGFISGIFTLFFSLFLMAAIVLIMHIALIFRHQYIATGILGLLPLFLLGLIGAKKGELFGGWIILMAITSFIVKL